MHYSWGVAKKPKEAVICYQNIYLGIDSIHDLFLHTNSCSTTWWFLYKQGLDYIVSLLPANDFLPFRTSGWKIISRDGEQPDNYMVHLITSLPGYSVHVECTSQNCIPLSKYTGIFNLHYLRLVKKKTQEHISTLNLSNIFYCEKRKFFDFIFIIVLC